MTPDSFSPREKMHLHVPSYPLGSKSTFLSRGKAITYVTIGFSVLMVLGGACQLKVEQERLVGIWTDGRGELRLEADGTWRMTHLIRGVTEVVLGTGTFRIEGARLRLDTAGGLCYDARGTYEVELSEDGELKFTEGDDLCGKRWSRFTYGDWRHRSP
jgi:hypothetical protein